MSPKFWNVSVLITLFIVHKIQLLPYIHYIHIINNRSNQSNKKCIIYDVLGYRTSATIINKINKLLIVVCGNLLA